MFSFLFLAFFLSGIFLISAQTVFASNNAVNLIATPKGCGSTGKVTVEFTWLPADNFSPGDIAPLSQWLDYALTPDVNGAIGTVYFGNRDVTGASSTTFTDAFAINTDYWWRINTNWGGFLGGWVSSSIEHFKFDCNSTGGPEWNNPGPPPGPFNILDIFQPAKRFGSFGQLASDVLLILVSLAGALALIFIVISGFKFVTSSGDEKALASAKATLTYAIIGIVVVILAFVMVQILQYFLQSNIPIT